MPWTHAATHIKRKYAKPANAQSREVVNGAAANDSDNSRIDNLPLDDFNHIVFHSPTCKLVSKAYARLLYNDYLTRPSHPEFNSVNRRNTQSASRSILRGQGSREIIHGPRKATLRTAGSAESPTAYAVREYVLRQPIRRFN